LKNKIEIQILTPATREQLVELRDELRKIDGFEAFDLQLPATPLIQGKMGLELIILEAVLSGVSHFAAEKSMEECHEQISSVFNRIMRRKPRQPEVGVEAMSGMMPVESDKWKYAIAENSNGTTTVTEYDNTGAVNVFSNREYSIDPEHTHVVLIGVSDYEDTANFSRIPPVAGNLDEMYSIFSDRSLVGIPFENITRLYNENCINTKDVLRKVSRTKDIRTLIIYYSGHGQNTGNNSLSLIARDTRNIDEELHNDIPYSFIDKMMNTSPADQKIIFIDACHSGLAAQGRNSNVFDFEPVLGTFTLASTSAEDSSYFKRDAANTYFTSYLSDAFREGVSSGNKMLSLMDLFDYTKEKLAESSLPAPVSKSQLKNILADNFFISGNPGFSIDARLKKPAQLYQQGMYEDARREYIILEKEYPDNQQLRNEHVEFERTVEFNKLVKDGDMLCFRDRNYSAAQSKYRQALALKQDESVRDKIADCSRSIVENTELVKPNPIKKDPLIIDPEKLRRENENNFRKNSLPPVKRKTKPYTIAMAAIGVLLLILMSRYHREQTFYQADDTPYKYWGDTKDGKPDGEGEAEYKNEDCYDGEWVNGMYVGKGTYKWADGRVYTGHFKNSQQNGDGHLVYKTTGNEYNGNWTDGDFEGFGIYTWKDGDIYKGDFHRGLRSGQGTYISAGGDINNCAGCRRYEGSWYNNVKNGRGSCLDVNGRLLYAGDFRDDKPVGPYPGYR
jgi:hypothetical protein